MLSLLHSVHSKQAEKISLHIGSNFVGYCQHAIYPTHHSLSLPRKIAIVFFLDASSIIVHPFVLRAGWCSPCVILLSLVLSIWLYNLLDARLLPLQMTTKRSIHFIFCGCCTLLNKHRSFILSVGSTFASYDQYIICAVGLTSVPSWTSENYQCSPSHNLRAIVPRHPFLLCLMTRKLDLKLSVPMTLLA